MPPDPRRTGRAASFAAVVGALPYLLLIAAILILSFIVGSARAGTAQEMPEGTPDGKANGTSAEVPEGVPAAMPGGIEVGDGEASIGGEIYARRGCAKVGNIVAGDCEGQTRGKSGPKDIGGGFSKASTPERTTTPEEAIPDGSTTPQETTSPEVTTLTGEATAFETTSLETTGPEEEASACPTEPPEDVVEATVERAVDGDTIELTEEVEGTKDVRLIGVDTPELGEAGESGEPEPYAEEAAAFTSDVLSGEDVLLQIGEEETDGFGRQLAYVWTSEATGNGFVGGLKRMMGMGGPEFFNRTLLEEGFAKVLTIEPNDSYAGCFETAEREARDAGAGIWANDGGASGEQYADETGDGSSTEGTAIVEETAEATLLEQTVVHEFALARTSPESTEPDDSGSAETTLTRQQSAFPEAQEEESLEPATDNAAPAEDDSAAQDQYRRETAPTTEQTGPTPDYEKCESPTFLDSFSGEHETNKTVEVPNGSFLLAYRTQLLDEHKPGALLLNVAKYGSGDYLERIATDEAGTERTYVDSGPGELSLIAASDNFSYDVAVYGCGEKVAGQEPITQQPPGQQPVEQGSAPSTTEAASPPEEQAALPITQEPAAAQEPISEEEPVVAETFQPTTAETSSMPLEGLPTRQNSTGNTVAVLPDTGGPSLPALVLGAICVAIGLLWLSTLGRGCRRGWRLDLRAFGRRGARSGVRPEDR